jgi:chaperonin cofactor prefoldin
MLENRIEELEQEIERLTARIAHLAAQAERIEAGSVKAKEKFDPDGTLVSREEMTEVSHNSAVAYWKEVREAEKRLDELQAELRALIESELGQPLEVCVEYDGPETEDA